MHVPAGPVFNNQGVIAHPPMQVSQDQVNDRKREPPGGYQLVRNAPGLESKSGARREYLAVHLMAPTDEKPGLACSAAQHVRGAVSQRLAGHLPNHLVPPGGRVPKGVAVQTAKPGHRHSAAGCGSSAGLGRGVTAGCLKAQQVAELIGQSRH